MNLFLSLSIDVNLTDNKVYLMACRGDHVATVDTDLNIIIWDLKSQSVSFGIYIFMDLFFLLFFIRFLFFLIKSNSPHCLATIE